MPIHAELHRRPGRHAERACDCGGGGISRARAAAAVTTAWEPDVRRARNRLRQAGRRRRGAQHAGGMRAARRGRC
eukprot:198633-Chlamydomonas_euryale.AAC.5